MYFVYHFRRLFFILVRTDTSTTEQAHTHHINVKAHVRTEENEQQRAKETKRKIRPLTVRRLLHSRLWTIFDLFSSSRFCFSILLTVAR